MCCHQFFLKHMHVRLFLLRPPRFPSHTPWAYFLSSHSCLLLPTVWEPVWEWLPLTRPPSAPGLELQLFTTPLCASCLGPSRCCLPPLSTGGCSLHCPLQDLRPLTLSCGCSLSALLCWDVRSLGSEGQEVTTAPATHLRFLPGPPKLSSVQCRWQHSPRPLRPRFSQSVSLRFYWGRETTSNGDLN